MRQISFDGGITYMFGPHLEPVATVRSGETVEFVCQDSCGGQIQSEGDTLDQLQMDRVNGATGPVAVAGAQRGDAIRVRIRDIRVGPTGFQSIVSSYGVLGEEVRSPRTKMIPIREGKAVFSKGIRLPIRPHVGTIASPSSPAVRTFPGTRRTCSRASPATSGSAKMSILGGRRNSSFQRSWSRASRLGELRRKIRPS